MSSEAGDDSGVLWTPPADVRETTEIGRYLTWLVTQAGNNISRAARIADVDRTTLYRLMERHGLQRILSNNGGGNDPTLHDAKEI